jgi:hypothetical protein
MNAAGGNDTIFNFNASDTLDFSALLAGMTLAPTVAGLAGVVTVSRRADTQAGVDGQDTILSVTGDAGKASITLVGYNAGGLAGLLSSGNIVLPS